MSKGSKQRPFDAKKFGENYDKIFKEKQEETEEERLKRERKEFQEWFDRGQC